MSGTFTPSQAAFRLAPDGIETHALAVANDGARYVPFVGDATVYASTPDSATVSITGDLDVRVKLALADYTPGAVHDILSKNDTDASGFSFLCRLETSGMPAIYWSADGVNLLILTSDAAVGTTDGATTWIRWTLDVDNGASGRTARFYTSPDGVTWTQLGSDRTAAGVTSIFDSTALVRIGRRGNDANAFGPITGKVYYAELRNGIAGTVAAKFDPATDAANGATSWTRSGAETWTLTGTPWLAALSTNVTLPVYDTRTVLVRIRVQESGGASGLTSDTYPLQVSKNGGSYATVTTSTTGVRAVDSPTLTGGAATTNKLGAGSGSFVAGLISETGTSGTKQLTASNYTEFLYAVTLRAADLVAGDTLDFRLLRNAATMTYTVTPRITVGTVSAPATGTAFRPHGPLGTRTGTRQISTP